jgi:hypothetical protein
MKRTIRLTERDLTRLVKRIIKEGTSDEVLYAEKIMKMIDNFHMTCYSAVEDVYNEYDEIIGELESNSFSRLNDILGNFMHYMVGDVRRALETDNNKMVEDSLADLQDIIDNSSSEENEEDF